MAEQPAGPILDGLGIILDLSDGDLVASAMVIAKVVDGDGGVTLLLAESDGISWIEQLGLLTAASDLLRGGGYDRREDD